MNIRLATVVDAPAIAAIYRPYVTDSLVSFELEPPTEAVMAGRMAKVLQQLPWLLCELGGAIVGYAYAGKHTNGRPTNGRWIPRSTCTGTGTGAASAGRSTRSSWVSWLQQGYYTAYAGITLPMRRAWACMKLRFRARGGLPERGLQVRCWHDVGWWQKPLRPYAAPISYRPPRSITHKKEPVPFGIGSLASNRKAGVSWGWGYCDTPARGREWGSSRAAPQGGRSCVQRAGRA